MNVTGIGPLPWRLQREDADPPEWCEVVDATGAAVPFLSDFELNEVELGAAIEALLRVVNHYPTLLAAARAVVDENQGNHIHGGIHRYIEVNVDDFEALRVAVEAAEREGRDDD